MDGWEQGRVVKQAAEPVLPTHATISGAQNPAQQGVPTTLRGWLRAGQVASEPGCDHLLVVQAAMAAWPGSRKHSPPSATARTAHGRPLSLAKVQTPQVPVAVSQMGASSGHCALAVHLHTPPLQTLPAGQALPQAPPAQVKGRVGVHAHAEFRRSWGHQPEQFAAAPASGGVPESTQSPFWVLEASHVQGPCSQCSALTVLLIVLEVQAAGGALGQASGAGALPRHALAGQRGITQAGGAAGACTARGRYMEGACGHR